MTSITDIGLQTGCCFAWIRIDTKDPSVSGGRLRVMLPIAKAKRVHTIMKNLIEEDELRSTCLCGSRSILLVQLTSNRSPVGLRGGKELEEML